MTNLLSAFFIITFDKICLEFNGMFEIREAFNILWRLLDYLVIPSDIMNPHRYLLHHKIINHVKM